MQDARAPARLPIGLRCVEFPVEHRPSGVAGTLNGDVAERELASSEAVFQKALPEPLQLAPRAKALHRVHVGDALRLGPQGPQHLIVGSVDRFHVSVEDRSDLGDRRGIVRSPPASACERGDDDDEAG